MKIRYGVFQRCLRIDDKYNECNDERCRNSVHDESENAVGFLFRSVDVHDSCHRVKVRIEAISYIIREVYPVR